MVCTFQSKLRYKGLNHCYVGSKKYLQCGYTKIGEILKQTNQNISTEQFSKICSKRRFSTVISVHSRECC